MGPEPLQLWTYRHAAPGRFDQQARRAEDEGWDGIALGESQNLTADPFVELGIAARFTSRILLGTSVAVVATRHPATTATAIATVHEESRGRAVLAIGTGASAVAHLGLRPTPVARFERYLTRLAGYLAGDDVPFDPETDGYPGSAAMGLAGGPTASRLHWLNPALPKVVLDVAATGPRTIAAAARIGDRALFATGCSPERLAWAVGTAREAREAAGLPRDGQAFGASFPLFVHPDRARARDLISGTVASFAHLATVLGPAVGPVTGGQRAALTALRDSYDMDRHLAYGSPQSRALTDELVDAFAVAGPVSYCAERILELRELGISKFVFFSEGAGMDPDEVRAGRRRIAEELLPALR